MSLTRIYLPLNAVRLRELAESRVVGPSPLAAHGVTDGVRAADPTGDDEECEYVALSEAAQASAAGAAGGVSAAGSSPRPTRRRRGWPLWATAARPRPSPSRSRCRSSASPRSTSTRPTSPTTTSCSGTTSTELTGLLELL